jgi:hypothetical protein
LTDFEQELEATDVKTILLGIHAEVAKLRMAVEQSESETETYACHDCSETFSDGSALIGHAIEVHKAPPNMELETYGKRV